jgi:branched-chain amino acid aminotransferase
METREYNTVELDWRNLAFRYLPTNGYVQYDYAEGDWSGPVIKTDPSVSVHVAANCLHYGQACFEGLKAFQQRDGSVALFRPDRNARRLIQSADRICMVSPPETMFIEACEMAVRINREFVPPYGTGASMYVRPLLIGTEPMVGINQSSTYTFIVLVTPVGPYYKEGFRPVEALVVEGYDRAAPLGTGRAKIAGNYAASLKPGLLAKQQGYPIVLYTDPRENKYIDEFGTSNFIAITHDYEFITPDSPSVLEGITKDSLQVLAGEMGMAVKPRPILLDELDQCAEVGACGTAAVITPIYAITKGQQRWTFGRPDEAGENLQRLYRQLQGIQYGEIEDTHHWLVPIELD